jgi:serine/threonine protein kinase
MSSPSPVEAIFLAALEKETAEQRAAYVEGACGGDPDLCRQVRRLLDAHPQVGNFLELPAAKLVATVDEPSVSERPGMVIGAYKLLEQIGEGGFGVVFMAEQLQPVRRKVALKVLKPGMDTRQVIARFEAERQALALMDHPNIARVFDGGATAGGRPYFIMELVKGIPITEYCDQSQLTPRQRLELFLPVCHAVQHAHQKGIIHRDIKPSNVLVTLHDGTPVPKIIDFGIAKALGQQLTDKTLYTGFAQLVGTPLYMSPEQAALSGLDVDTRSDIYALGVLLYELLTGTTPFDKERLCQAGYDELRRIIREEEPPKPSTRMRTLGQAATIVSTQRKSNPKQLSRLLRGELDWIVMKCLEKDRNRRYETANALAGDVQRYLHDEAVQACPPSASYRFRKFARRHKGPLAAGLAAALVVLLAVAGLVVSNVLITREGNQKEEARQRAQRNLRLALKALDEIYLRLAEQRLPRDPRGKQEDRELLENALVFYRQFAAENGADPSVRLDVIRAYRRVGDIERLVGEHDAARQAYADAITKAEQLVADATNEPEYAYELAVGRNALGELLVVDLGAVEAANDQLRSAIQGHSRLVQEFPARPEYREELARAYHVVGLGLKQQGQKAAALEQFRRAIDLQSTLAKEFPVVARYRADLAQMHRSAGRWDALGVEDRGAELAHLRRAGELMRGLVKEYPAIPLYRQRLAAALGELTSQDPSGTEKHWEEVIELQRQLVAEFPTVPEYRSDLACSYNNIGYQHAMAGRLEPGAEGYSKSLELSRRLFKDSPGVPRYRNRLAVALLNHAQVSLIPVKDFKQARDLLKEAVAHWQALLEAYPQNLYYRKNLVTSCSMLSGILAALGQQDEAAGKLQEAEQVFRKTLAMLNDLPDGPSQLGSHCRAIVKELSEDGNWWAIQGGAQQAAANYALALRIADVAIELEPRRAESWSARAWAHLKSEHWDKSIADYTKAIELAPDVHTNWWHRGIAYKHLGQWDKFAADYTSLLEKYPNDYNALHSRAVAYVKLNQPERAVADLRQAFAKGYKDLQGIKKDESFAALRAREDFQKLLAELEASSVRKK